MHVPLFLQIIGTVPRDDSWQLIKTENPPIAKSTMTHACWRETQWKKSMTSLECSRTLWLLIVMENPPIAKSTMTHTCLREIQWKNSMTSLECSRTLRLLIVMENPPIAKSTMTHRCLREIQWKNSMTSLYSSRTFWHKFQIRMKMEKPLIAKSNHTFLD